MADERRTYDRRTAARRGADRRESCRIPLALSVDYRHKDTYLFAYATNISVMGIFIQTNNPEPPGSKLTMEFKPPLGGDPIRVAGEVMWVNTTRVDRPDGDPGMGIRFDGLDQRTRETLLDLVRRIAYVDPPVRLGHV